MTMYIRRSFADPSGSVFQTTKGYVRPIDGKSVAEFESLLGCRFFVEGVSAGALPATRIERETVLQLLSAPVGPVTYPWEWSPGQLARAGEFMLDLAIGAFEEGYVLKDAQARNVVFEGLRPVFVDIGSFQPYVGEPVWLARGQFDRQFLLPLLAFIHRGLLPSAIHRVEADGLQPAAARRLLGLRAWSGLAEIETCALPSAKPTARHILEPARRDLTSVGSSVYRTMLLHTKSLMTKIARRVQQRQRTAWGVYGDGGFHYGEAELRQKKDWIRTKLSALRAETMVDIGANTGTFSRLGAELKMRCLAIESDAGALDALLARTPVAAPVSPLLMDMCMPTSAGGWEAREFASFDERFDGWGDLVLALAVVHHLAVRGYGYAEFMATAKRLTRRYALIEFVDPSDEMFTEMLATRRLDEAKFQRAAFMNAFEQEFRILDSLDLKDGRRCLVLGERYA